MKHRTLRLVLLAAVMLLAGCHSKNASNKLYNPSQVAFSARCNPILDNQLYPSLILAVSGQQGSDTKSLPADCSTLQVSVTAPTDNCVLRVVLDSSVINYVTISQEILPHRGESYTFDIKPKWKYNILRKIRQPAQVDLTLTCYINDEEVDIKNLNITCRSVNECPLSLKNTDFRFLFAAYVNEDHPQIEHILTEILDQGIVTRLSGYQAPEREVRNQVFAVWYYALSRGISYSSISCTSNPSPTANVQHIRFFDEVWNTRQANCIDACVFLASILRKTGLKPVIFVEPCHAYLGYYTDRNRRHLNLLETTITSWVNFPDLERSLLDDGTLPQEKFNKISKYLSAKDIERYNNHQLSFEQLKLAVAKSLFDKASEYNRENYEANRQHFADTTSISYQQLDIEQLRKIVKPIQ